jgi:hypothetical protein
MSEPKRRLDEGELLAADLEAAWPSGTLPPGERARLRAFCKRHGLDYDLLYGIGADRDPKRD